MSENKAMTRRVLDNNVFVVVEMFVDNFQVLELGPFTYQENSLQMFHNCQSYIKF